MTECIEVTTSKNKAGYGVSRINVGKHVAFNVLAHRVAWEMEHSPIPAGLLVCHTCDNKACVNVDHLFIGTHGDNLQDLGDKGLHPNTRKTHCPRGHEYNEENTKLMSSGSRTCRACIRIRSAQHRLARARKEKVV